MVRSHSLWAFVASIILQASPANSHSWVEQLNVIAPNGTFTGSPGYVRGQVVRGPDFTDSSMVNLIPPNGRSTGNAILSTDLMCKNTQTVGNYSQEFPMLQASAGDLVALRYQENGHVTQPFIPAGKPAHSGAVYIYGTTQPRDNDTLLAIHKVWNSEGTGGDGRGRLLATRNFDDGQCYQVNSAAISLQRQQDFPKQADALMGVNLWCQTDIQIPSNITNADSYSLYWVWDWPTAENATLNTVATNETYTTCMDIQLSSNLTAGTAREAVSFVENQDINNAAIASELTQQFDVTGTATDNSMTVPSTTVSATATHKSTKTSNAVTVTVTAAASIQYVTVTETVTAGETTTASESESAPTQETSAGGVYGTTSTASTQTSASATAGTATGSESSGTLSTSTQTSISASTTSTSTDEPETSSQTTHVSVPSYSTLRVPTTVSTTPALATSETTSHEAAQVKARETYAYAGVPRIRGRAPGMMLR